MEKRCPDCFDSYKQWREWHTLSRLAPPTAHNAYCEDCTPAYKQRMMQQHKCEHPNVQFKQVSGEFVGVRPRGQA